MSHLGLIRVAPQYVVVLIKPKIHCKFNTFKTDNSPDLQDDEPSRGIQFLILP